MSKKNSKPSNKKSKMKYILGTGAILVSTTVLPKVLKKTTNYLYKKQKDHSMNGLSLTILL